MNRLKQHSIVAKGYNTERFLKENKGVLCLFLLLFGLYLLFIPISSHSMHGVVIGTIPTNSGFAATLIVQLQENRRIHVNIPNQLPLKIGAHVELLENKTLFLGTSSYDFYRYMD